MPSEQLLSTIRACALEFGVKTVWLFGSALEDESAARDIDLAVEGSNPGTSFGSTRGWPRRSKNPWTWWTFPWSLPFAISSGREESACMSAEGDFLKAESRNIEHGKGNTQMSLARFLGPRLQARKRGWTLYAAIVAAVGVLAWLPYAICASIDDIQHYAILSAPVVVVHFFSPGMFLTFVLHSAHLNWINMDALLGLLVTSLLYYAVILAPLGWLLVTTNGRPSQEKDAILLCVVSQIMLLGLHAVLCVGGLALLRA